MSKLTKPQREELRSLVVNASIRRLTAKEICAYIFDRLGVSISVDHIKHLKADPKRDCAKELLLLQKDREYYLQRMFFDRVDELQYQQRVLHEVIDANKHNPDVQIKAVNALHGITVNMTRLCQSLPVSTFYIPTDDNDDAMMINQQRHQQQRLPPLSRPIFDEHDDMRMAEQGQLQEPPFDDSDQP